MPAVGWAVRPPVISPSGDGTRLSEIPTDFAGARKGRPCLRKGRPDIARGRPIPRMA